MSFISQTSVSEIFAIISDGYIKKSVEHNYALIHTIIQQHIRPLRLFRIIIPDTATRAATRHNETQSLDVVMGINVNCVYVGVTLRCAESGRRDYLSGT